MKKQLLTVGDSYTYGDELTDRYQAWPYRLADRLTYEVQNKGQSGISNTSILRRTLEELAINSYDLVIIGWTNPGRIEWKDAIGVAYDIWPGVVIPNKFTEDHPWRTDLITYINQHHSPEYLYEQYLIQVISLQSYFQAHDIKYRMIDIAYKNYYRQVGQEQHDQLSRLIDTDYFIGWDQFGMNEIAGKSRAYGGHPTDAGHQQIANKIYEHLGN